MTRLAEVAPAASTFRRWPASLDMQLACRDGRTRLVGRRQRGPLALQRTLYPEGDVAHLVLLHPPGGVAGGDSLDISLAAREQAAVLLTTPGATKFYRGNGVAARQHQEIRAMDGAVEWMPQENIFFDGASVSLSSDYHVGATGKLCALEVHAFGRAACDERFEHGEVASRVRVLRGERLQLLESARIEPANGRGTGAAGLRGYGVSALLLAIPATQDMLDAVRKVIARAGFPCAVTLLDDLLVLRCLGQVVEEVRAVLVAAWTTLRPSLLGREAVAPRIWQT